MGEISLTLSEAELRDAVRKHVEAMGFEITGRFSVRVTTTRDRPFDADYTSASVSGVKAREPQE